MAEARTSSRIAWADIAKGFAIICVVIGHVGAIDMPQALVRFCFTFHMPLFFVLSGWFLRPTERLTGEFLRKNVKGLLVPYYVIGLVFVVVACAKCLVMDGAGSLLATIARSVVQLGYAAGAREGLPAGVEPIGAIWFLWGLFWARLLTVAVRQAGYPMALSWGLFYAARLIGHEHIWLPLSFQSGMMAVLFVYLGQEMRAHGIMDRGALPPLLWVALALVWGYCIVWGGNVYMVSAAFGDGLIDVLGALAGCLCIFKISEGLDAYVPRLARPLEKLGAITLPVLGAHIIELNLFPYHWFFLNLGLGEIHAIPQWIVLLCVRTVVIVLLSALLWALPRPLSGWLYASRRLPQAQETRNKHE